MPVLAGGSSMRQMTTSGCSPSANSTALRTCLWPNRCRPGS